MSKSDTNQTKQRVMLRIANLIGGNILGRTSLKSKEYSLLAYASKNYHRDDALGKSLWYGLFEKDFKEVNDKTIFLFTTDKIESFLLIPAKDFMRKIKPYLQGSKVEKSFFLAVSEENGKWFIPISYIPSGLRSQIKDSDRDLTEYANNLSPLGLTYADFLGEEEKTSQQVSSIESMVRLIAEKDPGFLTKSIEEKLIILRYYQIETFLWRRYK